MCGIAGIVELGRRARPDGARLSTMRDVLAHRGPDDAGLWIEGRVGLAHRRLAIVDVAGGRQPMSNEDGTVVVVFNGEIYDHAAHRPGLEARGHRYRTQSDTETIVHLYEEEGDACVERLRGMFAFALWDARRERLLLARDRLGIKPLYFARTGDRLLFASEIKALVAGGLRPELRRDVLPELLANGFVAGAETLFEGVEKLLPGRTLSWSAADGFVERRYWRPPPVGEGERGDPEAEASGVRERLFEAVQSHLMSDVPLGVFLSGGLDSAGIAAVAARAVQGPIRTFSVGFDAPEVDERPWARTVARAIGAIHREVVVSPREFFAALPALVWHEDEPLAYPSSVPLYFVSRLAREDVKVVLTGEGADELFLGYNRHRFAFWNARLGRPFWALPRAARRAVGRAVEALPGRAGRWAARSFLARDPDPRDLYCESFAVFSTPLQRRLLRDPGSLDVRDPHAEALARWADAGGDVLARMSRADLETGLVELLMKQDQMSMAASVESRVPYLDHVFVEHALSLPSAAKVQGLRTKAVLRAALRGVVPDPILRRKKMGFPVPLGEWLRGPYFPLVEDLVLSTRARARGLFDPEIVARLAREHRTGARDHAHRLWLLCGLETWMRIFLDGDVPASLAEAA